MSRAKAAAAASALMGAIAGVIALAVFAPDVLLWLFVAAIAVGIWSALYFNFREGFPDE